MQYQCAVEIERLTKRYRSAAVINNLTLSIQRGEVVGILGPNGAGKSTLMRLLIGAMKPTSGQIKILEKQIGDPELRHRIGYLPEECPLRDYLGPTELLSLHASLARIPRREVAPRISAALDRVGISENRRIRELSRGTRQKLAIAMAILHNPDLIILDEPTSALDQKGRAMVRELIIEMAGAGRTILIKKKFTSAYRNRECVQQDHYPESRRGCCRRRRCRSDGVYIQNRRRDYIVARHCDAGASEDQRQN